MRPNSYLNSIKRHITDTVVNDPTPDIESGLVHYPNAITMIGYRRLENLQECIETAIRDKIPGDLIETGVWRGGASIFMAATLKAYFEQHRNVWVADSFQGLPEPEYDQDRGDKHHLQDWLKVSSIQVLQNFDHYDLLQDNIKLLPGWFKDTLPAAPIEKIAVMRLDGDMYGSTMEALNSLYFKLSPGGFCIIDDYGLPGCKSAVTDFRKTNNISEPLIPVDWTGVYWRKDF